MKDNSLIELYEASEKRIDDATNKVKLYRNISFLSLGLAGVSIGILGVNSSEYLSGVGTVGLIAGGMGALYSTMMKNLYQVAQQKRTDVLDVLSKLLSPEDKQQIEKRKEEMKNLQEELTSNNVSNLQIHHSLKKLKR